VFNGSNGLRGYKGSLYEGGLRVPLIAWGPGRIPAGTTSESVCAFWDFLPTFAELAGVPTTGSDGISIVPALQGKAESENRTLYWELGEGAMLKQAVRTGDWKGVRNSPNASVELYNLRDDPGELRDVSASNPDLVRQIEDTMRTSHRDAPVLTEPGWTSDSDT
jgi:arylsulfatase A-like enzyme